MCRQQPPVQNVHQVLDAAFVIVAHEHAQFFANRQQELDGRQARIQDHRHVRMLRHLFQEGTDDRGFARPHLAGQLNESACFVDAVQQMRQRLGMAFAHVEVARIRRNRERLFAQAKEAGVHAGLGSVDIHFMRRVAEIGQ